MKEHVTRRNFFATAGVAAVAATSAADSSGGKSIKILGISCSPRKGMTTAKAVQAALDAAKGQARLETKPDKLWSLAEMERTVGEPDVVGVKSGEFVFMDFAPESPAGRRAQFAPEFVAGLQRCAAVSNGPSAATSDQRSTSEPSTRVVMAKLLPLALSAVAARRRSAAVSRAARDQPQQHCPVEAMKCGT